MQRVSHTGIRKEVIQDNKLYAHTVFHDDKSLDQNEKIRHSKMLEKARLGLHDDEDVRCVLSIPDTLQWMYFCRDNPDIKKMLHSKDEADRMRAVHLIQLLKPSWVVMHRL